MNTTLVLDLLLAFIVLLFVPIGVWRGAAKETVVSASVLLGAAIAGAWATSWGGELAPWLRIGSSTGRFWVAVAIVVLCVLLLGYGGGAALGPLRPGWGGRLVGGLLAGLNAAVLIGLTLGYIERYLLAGESVGALDDGLVAWALMRRFDWLLVAAALLLLPCVGAGAIAGVGREEPAAAPSPTDPQSGAADARHRPVRVPSAADAWKVEPLAPPSPGGAETIDVRPARPSAAMASWPAPPRREDDRSNGHGRRTGSRFAPGRASGADGLAERPVAEEWLRRAGAMTRPAEGDAPDNPTQALANPAASAGERSWGASDDGPPAPPTTADPARPSELVGWSGRFGASGPRPQDAAADASPGRDRSPATARCVTCGAAVEPSDVFCARCGAAV